MRRKLKHCSFIHPFIYLIYAYMQIIFKKYNWRGTAGIWTNKKLIGLQKQKQWAAIAILRVKKQME